VVLDVAVVGGRTADSHALHWRHPTVGGDDEVDSLARRRLETADTVGVERIPAGQCRRCGVENGRPRALLSREGAGVIGVHTCEHPGPLAPAQPALDVVVRATEPDDLRTGDHAALTTERAPGLGVIHPRSTPSCPGDGKRPRTACGRERGTGVQVG